VLIQQENIVNIGRGCTKKGETGSVIGEGGEEGQGKFLRGSGGWGGTKVIIRGKSPTREKGDGKGRRKSWGGKKKKQRSLAVPILRQRKKKDQFSILQS